MLTQAQFDEVGRLHAELEKTKRSAWGPIFDKLDKILQPMIDAAQTAAREQLEEWISKLPYGFYRAELRVVVIHRFENDKTEQEQAA